MEEVKEAEPKKEEKPVEIKIPELNIKPFTADTTAPRRSFVDSNFNPAEFEKRMKSPISDLSDN